MARTKSIVIDPALLKQFEDALEAKSTDDVNDISYDIEDIPAGGDSDMLIVAKELPKEIPAEIRMMLMAKSREAYRLMNEVQYILGVLSQRTTRIYNAKHAADERARPRCEKCAQPLPSKKRR